MEISGRILREVEFRDRLRGYDTDEVDEFLEKVAVGVDELTAEVASLRERTEHPVAQESAQGTIAFPDDEAIRRTLVLAQRTADLAIKEAEEEAQHQLDEARARAETIVAKAEDDAQRTRDAAEFDLQARVTELSERRDRLEREVAGLTELLAKERERLGDALSSALRFVNDTLLVSDELADASHRAEAGDRGAPGADRGAPEGGGFAHFDFASAHHDLDEPGAPTTAGDSPPIPDIESEIAEDAELAFGGPRPPRRPLEETDESDEELWERWANSSPLGADAAEREADPFGPERRPGRP